MAVSDASGPMCTPNNVEHWEYFLKTDACTSRFGFVMEQTLGHVTHYTNLRAAVDAETTVQATWYPIAFEPATRAELLPPLSRNWSLRASWRARRELALSPVEHDALFFHTQVTTLFSVPLMRRIPSVVSLDATPMNYDTVGAAYGHRPASGAVERLKRRANARSLQAAAALVTWCDWARRSLIEDYGVDSERISVIPPGVNLDLWPRPSWGESGDPVRILFVGGDFARKGGDILLEAFAGLPRSCELHVVTKAPMPAASQLHVYNEVAPNSEILRRLYAKADIFVLPTLADCFPLVIQEAMAAGLPVVSTSVGAVGEAVRDRETGVVVPAGDARSLHAALEALVGNESTRQAMGARGREVAEARFDSVVNAQRVLDLMRGLLETREIEGREQCA